MSQPAYLEEQYHDQTFSIAPGCYTTRQSPCVYTLADPAKELDKLTGAKKPARKSNVGSYKTPTKANTPHEALTLPFVLLFVKDLFTKFMKMFMETT